MSSKRKCTVTEDGGLIRVFAKPTFNADKYVTTKVMSGDLEINKAISQINSMLDETSSQMKKAIFNNYNLFIDAGKAAYHLESSMHQMHHHLKEQQHLLNTLADMKLFPENDKDIKDNSSVHSSMVPLSLEQQEEEDSRSSLASLLERVEGSSNVAAVPGRRVLFEGDLNELDSENFNLLNTLHVFLMNDAVLISSKLLQRRGPIRYKFQALYELDSVALVNIRERDGQSTPSHAFKIMVFPETRIFQTEGPKAKKDWMEAIDKTKRRKATEKSKKRESSIAPSSPASHVNPFEEFLTSPKTPPPSRPLPPSPSCPRIPPPVTFDPWLEEAPEDLDVCVAERNLLGAVELVEQVNERLAELTAANGGVASDRLAEFRARIDQRVAILTETLQHELVTGAERHGGVRSVRSAVTQLIRLGKSSLACQLFLDYRSSVMDYQMQLVKQEGSQHLYIVKLSFAFHRGVFETGHEFKKIFDKHRRFTARLCAWCTVESDKFADKLRLLLIDSRSVSFTAMALTFEHIHAHSEKVTEKLGVDITFNLNHALKDSWQHAAEEQSHVLKDSLQLRASEDKWRHMQFTSSKEVDKFFKEMRDAKIVGIEAYLSKSKSKSDSAHLGPTNNSRLSLTENTCQFAKSLVLFAESLSRLRCRELFFVFSECCTGLLSAELLHYRRVLSSQQFIREDEEETSALTKRNFIVGNLTFLVNNIVPKIEKYLDCADCPNYKLVKAEMQQVLSDGKGYSV